MDERPIWTVERIRSLGAVTDIVTAGQIFGLSRNTAYSLAATGEFPVPVLRIGRQLRVSVAAILHRLNIPVNPPAATADPT